MHIYDFLLLRLLTLWEVSIRLELTFETTWIDAITSKEKAGEWVNTPDL